MPATQLFAGLVDPDCTTLDLGTVVYFLTAWAAGVETRNSETGGVRVHAQIYTIGEQSQRTLLYDGVVFTAAAGHVVDSVRCVHANSAVLIVYFLDRDTAAGTTVLKARFVEVAGFDSALSWAAESDISVDDGGLYDVKQVDDPASVSEYMLAWISAVGAPGTVIVRRVDSEDHTAAVWSTSLSVNVVDRVCAVHADGATSANNGGVAVAVQNTASDLIVHVLDYSDGTNVGSLTPISSTSAEFCAVGLCKAGTSATYIVAELFETLTPALGAEDDYAHLVATAEIRINSTPAILNTQRRAYNLNMLSKPYSYVDAQGDRHVYCGLAYSSVWFDDPYREQNAFICDMGLQDAAQSDLRPRPVTTYANQNVDCRNHGYSPEISARFDGASGIGKRMNHLSNFAHGPSWLCDLRKARAVAWPMWGGSRLIESGAAVNPRENRLEPVFAQAQIVWQYLEDPWTVNRDPADHTQPTLNFHASNPLSLHDNVEVQDELLIAGGTPHLYDGKQLIELGFPWTPEIIDVTDNPSAGGSMEAGTRRYTAVFEWRDAKGQLHRSGHGNIIRYVAPGADSAVLTIRTLTIGERTATWLYPTSQPITIAIYRTTVAQPNIFRRLNATSLAGFTIADSPVNDPSVWAINFTDDVTDVVLAGAPPLNIIDGGNAEQYTELPPATPPAAHLVANWQNRAWLVASERRELWYSKENLPTAATGRIAPEFHPSLRFTLEEVDGDVTGIEPLDNGLVIFTRDGIYELQGSGPDTLGQGAAYQLQVLHRGTGCIEPRSVVAVPMGLMFQSYKGLTLLDKGRTLDYISAGSPVEDLVRQGGNVRSGTYLPDRWTVAFVSNGTVTDQPRVWKWDFLHKQWSTAALEPPNTTTWLSSTAGGCAWQGNERDASHVVLCQGGLLIERGKDDATPYQDEDDVGSVQEILIDVETGWIALAGIAGYKRVREIGVQTEIIGTAQHLYADLYYDVDGSYSLASPEVKQPATPSAYMRLRPRIQKFTAFRIRIYEPGAVAAAENRKIHGITVNVGVKKGPRKVSDSQQV